MEPVTVVIIISSFALVASGLAILITHNFSRRQKSLTESQEKLNNLILKRGIQSSLKEKKADVGATISKIGFKGPYQLKVWNKGKSTARNVTVHFPEDNFIIHSNEILSKTPIASLEPHCIVDFLTTIPLGTKAKQVMVVSWDDESTGRNEKTIQLTIP